MRLCISALISPCRTDPSFEGRALLARSSARWTARIGLGLAVLAGTSLPLSFADADGSLTLELPPSPAAREARTGRHVPPPVARTPVTPSGAGHAPLRGRYSSRGATRATHVVGRLGQLDQQTRIYRSPNSRSRLLTTASAGTYIALQQDEGAWYGVLMADGSTGWLPKSSVRRLDYQVVSTGARSYGGSYPSGTSTPMLTSSQEAILNEAYRYLGVRYTWGGNDARGIDCSGFVKNVFAACGYALPRTATEQMAYGMEVPPDQLQPADRLYFGHKKSGYGVTHTGIYIGNGYFIHSSSSRHGVAVSRLDEPMFARIFVCARR